MSRFFIEIKYDGTDYHGWQIQQNAHAVQAEINNALSTLLQEEILVSGAGRTDTGVHAQQFFAHFDTHQNFDKDQLIYKLNYFLPPTISCSSIVKVIDNAHARYSAIERTYEYWITPTKNPFLNHKAYYFPFVLNLELMNEAVTELLKSTDFSCFSKSNTDTLTNDCTINFARWEVKNDGIIFTISANRFLRNMVRAIVGTLLEIGQERITIDDFKKIINSKNRSEAGVSVPAHGLYLTAVKYPKEIFIA
ncbi:MAG: tRNA pseudouridine(38-40) synthase TruA [Bacteroidetes bacterium RIFCSPLOWO2_12_FULL_31_6]|nr:MAG: tRNA pseudouridine(38-40) synthase TruA [Bacteroidetes bacterium RIFCSPLOWO2_12_FULL_31_6]